MNDKDVKKEIKQILICIGAWFLWCLLIYFLVNVILNFKYCEIKDCTDYAHRTEFAKIFHYILYGVEVITLIIFLTVKIKRIMSTKNKKIMFLKIIKYLIIIFLIHFCIMHLHGIVELIKRCGEDWSYPYHWDCKCDCYEKICSC